MSYRIKVTTYKVRPYTQLMNTYKHTYVCKHLYVEDVQSFSRHLRTHVFVYGQFVLPLYRKLLSSSLFLSIIASLYLCDILWGQNMDCHNSMQVSCTISLVNCEIPFR